MKLTNLSGLYASNDVSILLCSRELFQNVKASLFQHQSGAITDWHQGLA